MRVNARPSLAGRAGGRGDGDAVAVLLRAADAMLADPWARENSAASIGLLAKQINKYAGPGAGRKGDTHGQGTDYSKGF